MYIILLRRVNADLHSLAYAPIYVYAVHAHNYGNNKFRREDQISELIALLNMLIRTQSI